MGPYDPNEHWLISSDVVCMALLHGLFALVDLEDYPKVSQYYWYPHRSRRVVYAVSTAQPALRMHRVITGAPKGKVVDHIDGNGLNNSSIFGFKNVRVVTNRENCQNRHVAKASEYPGVSWDHNKNKWMGRIRVGSERRWLGYSEDQHLLGKIYQEASAIVLAGSDFDANWVSDRLNQLHAARLAQSADSDRNERAR